MARRESTEPVPAVAVNPSVWADALRQADGDAARIEIISPTSVVVHNRPDWRDNKPADDVDTHPATNGTERKPEVEAARPAIPVAHPLADPTSTSTTTGPVAAQPIQVPTFVAPPRLESSDSDD